MGWKDVRKVIAEHAELHRRRTQYGLESDTGDAVAGLLDSALSRGESLMSGISELASVASDSPRQTPEERLHALRLKYGCTEAGTPQPRRTTPGGLFNEALQEELSMMGLRGLHVRHVVEGFTDTNYNPQTGRMDEEYEEYIASHGFGWDIAAVERVHRSAIRRAVRRYDADSDHQDGEDEVVIYCVHGYPSDCPECRAEFLRQAEPWLKRSICSYLDKLSESGLHGIHESFRQGKSE